MKINQKLLEALETRGLSEPTLAQSSTWPVIDSGSNVLLIAPTGVGKTKASQTKIRHAIITKKCALCWRVRWLLRTLLSGLTQDLIGPMV